MSKYYGKKIYMSKNYAKELKCQNTMVGIYVSKYYGMDVSKYCGKLTCPNIMVKSIRVQILWCCVRK